MVAQLQHDVPAMGQAWTRNGLVYLGGAALIHTTCGPTSRSSPSTTSRARKSPPPALGQLGAGHGAVAVAGNLNTYYEDIKSGVSNGVITFATGAWGAKVHEVAPHITKVNFGPSSRAALP